MRLLITGASGFLGSHLVNAAEAQGYEGLYYSQLAQDALTAISSVLGYMSPQSL